MLAVIAASGVAWLAANPRASGQATTGHAAVQPAPPPPFAIKAGVADPSNTDLPWYVARDGGLYAAQNLAVDIMSMGGGSRGVEELQAGRLDVMQAGLSSVIRVNQAGGDLRVVAALSNEILFALFTARNVKTAADLKGGVVAVSTFGSESDATTTLALQRLGLSRNDVTVKEYGDGRQRLAALQAGKIRATVLADPLATIARADGVSVLLDLVPEHIPWLFSGIIVRRSDIAARRDLLTRFLKASIEGNYMALADKKRAMAVLGKDLKISSAKVLETAYGNFSDQTPQNLEPSPTGVQNALKQFPAVSQKAANYVDTSLLDKLKADGFFTAMEQKYGR